MPDADWPGILPDVLLALEADGYLPAETRKQHGDEIRYRQRGSLSVDRRSAVYRDHEAGSGGGLLALIAHVVGGDERTAAQWLADRGFPGFERDGRGPERPRKRRTPRKRPVAPAGRRTRGSVEPARQAAALSGPERERVAVARRLIEAAGPDWPGWESAAYRWRAGVLYGDCPATLLWLPVAKLLRPAPGAVGALLTPRQPLGRWLAGDFEPVAVEVEYVAEDGGPVADDGGLRKRTYGLARGAVWSTGPMRSGRIHLAEGVADVLALAPYLRAGEDACATGGTSGLVAAAAAAADARRALVVHADADNSGAKAAEDAVRQFRRRAPGVEVRVLTWRPDPDSERRQARAARKPLRLPAWLYAEPEVAASVPAPAA